MIFKVDIDGVCIDSLTPWLRLYNRDYNDHLTPNDILEWDMVPFVKPECGAHIYDYLKFDSLYDDAQPLRGALEGVGKLRKLGKVVFVSAGVNVGKYKCMARHGFLDSYWQRSQELVIANDKSLLVDGIVIDDGPHNITDIRKSVLLDQPHNRWYDAKGHRVFDWDGVVKLATLLFVKEAK